MTTRVVDRCLRDPRWWLNVVVIVLISYLILRIPTDDQSPSGGLPMAWGIFPPAMAQDSEHHMAALMPLWSTLMAFTWPALILFSPGIAFPPIPLEEVTSVPHSTRRLAIEQVAAGLFMSLVILSMLAPLLAMTYRAGNMELSDLIASILVIHYMSIWVPLWVLLWTQPRPVTVLSITIAWLGAVLAVYFVNTWRFSEPLVRGQAVLHGAIAVLLLLVTIGNDYYQTRAPGTSKLAV